jgi:hypothetical protein
MWFPRFTARGTRWFHLISLVLLTALLVAHVRLTSNALTAPPLSLWILLLYTFSLVVSICLADFETAQSRSADSRWRPLIDRCSFALLPVAVTSAFFYLAVFIPLIPSLHEVDSNCPMIPTWNGLTPESACLSLLSFLIMLSAHLVPIVVALLDVVCVDRPFILRNACLDHLFIILWLALYSVWSVLSFTQWSYLPYSLNQLHTSASPTLLLLLYHVGVQIAGAISYQLCRALFVQSSDASGTASESDVPTSWTVSTPFTLLPNTAGPQTITLTLDSNEDFDIQTYHIAAPEYETPTPIGSLN